MAAEIVAAIDAMRAEVSPRNADRLLAAFDALILAPDDVTAPEPENPPEPPRDVYPWMRIDR